MPLYNLRTLEERLAINYWEQGIFGTLFSIFAASRWCWLRSGSTR